MEPQPKIIYLGIGTNLGNRLNNITQAITFLTKYNINISRTASIYETAPWGFESDEPFLNTVFEAHTFLTPENLLIQLKQIENEMGRVKKDKSLYENRLIDIDILLYASEVIHNESLCVPHALLHERNFVLSPLNELIPNDIHPILNKPFSALYDESIDKNIPFVVHNPLLIHLYLK